jgi:hypothetical protein
MLPWLRTLLPRPFDRDKKKPAVAKPGLRQSLPGRNDPVCREGRYPGAPSRRLIRERNLLPAARKELTMIQK